MTVPYLPKPSQGYCWCHIIILTGTMVVTNIIFIYLQKLSRLVQYWTSNGSMKFGLDAHHCSIKLCQATRTSWIMEIRCWFVHINAANDFKYHIHDQYICRPRSWSQISHVHVQRIVSSSKQYYFNQFFNQVLYTKPKRKGFILPLFIIAKKDFAMWHQAMRTYDVSYVHNDFWFVALLYIGRTMVEHLGNIGLP